MDNVSNPPEPDEEKCSTIVTTLISEPAKHDGTHGSEIKKTAPPSCSVNNRKSPMGIQKEHPRVQQHRDSPGIDDAIAKELRMILTQDFDDENTRARALGRRLRAMDILPGNSESNPNLQCVDRAQFSAESLLLKVKDETLDTSTEPIPAPRPDIPYGYTLTNFSDTQRNSQRCTIRGVDIAALATPTPALHWPFLAVELAGPARGGISMALANTCAASGSACVKAARTLFRLVSGGCAEPLDSIAYSLGMDGEMAWFHAHWFELDDGSFKAKRVQNYMLTRPGELRNLPAPVKNIVEWGLITWYKNITTALDVIFEEEVDRSRLKHKRRASSELVGRVQKP